MLKLLVHDTGIGNTTASPANIFTPFDRLGAERLMIEGTGLGLTLSKQLLEAMGDSIGVESVLGLGSTFCSECREAEDPPPRCRRCWPRPVVSRAAPAIRLSPRRSPVPAETP